MKNYFLKSTGERFQAILEYRDNGNDYIRGFLPPSHPGHKRRLQNVRVENLRTESSNTL